MNTLDFCYRALDFTEEVYNIKSYNLTNKVYKAKYIQYIIYTMWNIKYIPCTIYDIYNVQNIIYTSMQTCKLNTRMKML